MEEGLKINVTADVQKALDGLDLVYNAISKFDDASNVSLTGLISQLEKVNRSGVGASNALSNNLAPAIKDATRAATDAERSFSRLSLNIDPGTGLNAIRDIGVDFKKLQADLKNGILPTITINTSAAKLNLVELRQEAARVKTALNLSRDSGEQAALRASLAAIANEMDRITKGDTAAQFKQNAAASRDAAQANKVYADSLAKIPTTFNFQARATGLGEMTVSAKEFIAVAKTAPTKLFYDTSVAQRSVIELKAKIDGLNKVFDSLEDSAQRVEVGREIAVLKSQLKDIEASRAPRVLLETANALGATRTSAGQAAATLGSFNLDRAAAQFTAIKNYAITAGLSIDKFTDELGGPNNAPGLTALRALLADINAQLQKARGEVLIDGAPAQATIRGIESGIDALIAKINAAHPAMDVDGVPAKRTFAQLQSEVDKMRVALGVSIPPLTVDASDALKTYDQLEAEHRQLFEQVKSEGLTFSVNGRPALLTIDEVRERVRLLETVINKGITPIDIDNRLAMMSYAEVIAKAKELSRIAIDQGIINIDGTPATKTIDQVRAEVKNLTAQISVDLPLDIDTELAKLDIEQLMARLVKLREIGQIKGLTINVDTAPAIRSIDEARAEARLLSTQLAGGIIPLTIDNDLALLSLDEILAHNAQMRAAIAQTKGVVTIDGSAAIRTLDELLEQELLLQTRLNKGIAPMKPVDVSAPIRSYEQVQASVNELISKVEAVNPTLDIRTDKTLSALDKAKGIIQYLKIVAEQEIDLNVDTTRATQSISALRTEIARLKGLQDNSTSAADMNRYAASIHKAQTELNALERAQQRANAGIKRVGGASRESGVAIQNFGRVISDAPYGLIAIQNNIEPLLESFPRMAAEARAAGQTIGQTFIKALWSPTGAILGVSALFAGITYLTQKFGSFSNAMGAVGDLFRPFDAGRGAIRGLATEMEKAGEAFGKEVANATRYSSIIKDITSSTDERTFAVQKLTDMIRENLPLQDQELARTQALRGETTLLVEALVQRGKAAAGIAAIAKATAPLLENTIRQKEITEQLKKAEEDLAAERKASGKTFDKPLFTIPAGPANRAIPIYLVTKTAQLVSNLKLELDDLQKEEKRATEIVGKIQQAITGKPTASEVDQAGLKDAADRKTNIEEIAKAKTKDGKITSLNAEYQRKYNQALADEFEIKARLRNQPQGEIDFIKKKILAGEYDIKPDKEQAKINKALAKLDGIIFKAVREAAKNADQEMINALSNRTSLDALRDLVISPMDVYYEEITRKTEEAIAKNKPLIEKLIEQGLVDLPASRLRNPTFENQTPRRQANIDDETERLLRNLARMKSFKIPAFDELSQLPARADAAAEAMENFNKQVILGNELTDSVAPFFIDIFDQMTEKGAVFGEVIKNELIQVGKALAAATIKAAVFAAIMSAITGGIPGGGGFLKIFSSNLLGGGSGALGGLGKLLGFQANLGDKRVQQRTNQANLQTQIVGVVKGNDLMLIQQRTYSNNRRTN